MLITSKGNFRRHKKKDVKEEGLQGQNCSFLYRCGVVTMLSLFDFLGFPLLFFVKDYFSFIRSFFFLVFIR